MNSLARGSTAFGRTAIAVGAALLLAVGCTSQDDGRNAPLPRMAKDDALKWAKDSTAHMAELTGAELLPDTVRVNWEECVGENDEVAEDGRYSLFYYVYSPAPATEHTRMVRKLRSELPGEGYEVTSYREFKSAYASAVFRARDKKNDYSVEAETVGSGKSKPQRFSFAVRTPCLLPPGDKQQKF
ncbi:hypothetical protein [Streptomyces cylindrosporus]|uniref:Lipoprotein n=1 Tax=Streptomyces cylindrosporus TaxID=2927583 RepID=A0ABS9YKW1_9ACTN|nr:hypothetical protein [Streptomyces cylindrosporus]MCI3277902.1 hypothetical protein [Streptomyces cylindrosporus]